MIHIKKKNILFTANTNAEQRFEINLFIRIKWLFYTSNDKKFYSRERWSWCYLNYNQCNT